MHDFLFPAKSAYRQTTTDDFPQTGQIRFDVEQLLCSTLRNPKPTHNFIKDQDNIMPLSQLPQIFQKSLFEEEPLPYFRAQALR